MEPSPHETIAALVILGIFGLVICRFVLWVITANRTADPWGEEVEHALDQDDAVPLCNHCLSPQQHNGWFCPECGATVGRYCNYLPYVYLFSQGEVLRAGVGEHFRPRPIILIGYVLLSLHAYAVVAPLYWYFLARNLRHSDRPEAAG